MHKVASDMNKAKGEPFFEVAVPDRDHRDFSTGDSLQKDIFGWLSPPDPWKNHHAACKLRHPRSAEWFIHGNMFPEWKTSEGSLLWVHGKRLLILSFVVQQRLNILFVFTAGAGKSVFWYFKIFYFHFGNLSCSSAPQSSKTSMPCRKLDSRH
jgi:hypothetical protein